MNIFSCFAIICCLLTIIFTCTQACAIKDEFHEKIKELLKVEMPDDFYELFAFCKDMAPDSPKGKLKTFSLILRSMIILCRTSTDN